MDTCTHVHAYTCTGCSYEHTRAYIRTHMHTNSRTPMRRTAPPTNCETSSLQLRQKIVDGGGGVGWCGGGGVVGDRMVLVRKKGVIGAIERRDEREEKSTGGRWFVSFLTNEWAFLTPSQLCMYVWTCVHMLWRVCVRKVQWYRWGYGCVCVFIHFVHDSRISRVCKYICKLQHSHTVCTVYQFAHFAVTRHDEKWAWWMQQALEGILKINVGVKTFVYTYLPYA